MATTATVTTPDRSLLPSVPGPSRWLAAAALFAGAALQLAEEVIEPPFATDPDRYAWIAQHATWHAVDIVVGLVAVPLLIASVLILARLAWRMPRLARAGAACAVVGFTGLAAVHGFEAALVAMLDAGVSPVVVAGASGSIQPVLGVPMMIMFLGALTVGLPLLLIALWRSRAVPRGAIVLAFAFMIVDFVGPETIVPSHAISFVAFTWMAVSLLRRPRSGDAMVVGR